MCWIHAIFIVLLSYTRSTTPEKGKRIYSLSLHDGRGRMGPVSSLFLCSKISYCRVKCPHCGLAFVKTRQLTTSRQTCLTFRLWVLNAELIVAGDSFFSPLETFLVFCSRSTRRSVIVAVLVAFVDVSFLSFDCCLSRRWKKILYHASVLQYWFIIAFGNITNE